MLLTGVDLLVKIGVDKTRSDQIRSYQTTLDQSRKKKLKNCLRFSPFSFFIFQFSPFTFPPPLLRNMNNQKKTKTKQNNLPALPFSGRITVDFY